jgi:cytochrome c oxidase subunit 2
MASKHATEVELLFWVTMAVTFTVFIVTQVIMFYFGYKYRYKKERKAYFYPENHKLEIVWTVIPAIVLVGLIGWGLVKWNNIMGPAPKDAEVIEIVGYQFAWASRYPGPDNELGNANYKLIDVENIVGIDFTDSSSLDDFMPREIHIPKGKPVLFKIKARDVIHSVYLPYMRSQMNAVPGMPTQMWFIPTKTTAEMREETGNENFNFEIVCNKICGRAHFSMKHTVIVEEEWEYIKWKNEQKSWIEKNPDYYADFIKNNSTDVATLND